MVSRNAPNEDHEDGVQENDQEVDRDETDPNTEEGTFGRRRPDSVVVDWTNNVHSQPTLSKVRGETGEEGR